MSEIPEVPPPAPTVKSKTLWIAVAGILGALGTAAGMYAETGDWKAALSPLVVALISALAAALRDTIMKTGVFVARSNEVVAVAQRENTAELRFQSAELAAQTDTLKKITPGNGDAH